MRQTGPRLIAFPPGRRSGPDGVANAVYDMGGQRPGTTGGVCRHAAGRNPAARILDSYRKQTRLTASGALCYNVPGSPQPVSLTHRSALNPKLFITFPPNTGISPLSSRQPGATTSL